MVKFDNVDRPAVVNGKDDFKLSFLRGLWLATFVTLGKLAAEYKSKLAPRPAGGVDKTGLGAFGKGAEIWFPESKFWFLLNSEIKLSAAGLEATGSEAVFWLLVGI